MGVDGNLDAVRLQREEAGNPHMRPMWVLFVTFCNVPASRGRDSGREERWLKYAISVGGGDI